MFKAKLTYKEVGTIQRLELQHESLNSLLLIIAGMDDIEVIELHIIKERGNKC